MDPTAYIGRSVILVEHLSMGPGASIGPLNVIKDLEELRLAERREHRLAQLDHGVPAGSRDRRLTPFPQSPNRRPVLIMGKSRHDHGGARDRLLRSGRDRGLQLTGRIPLHVLTHSLNLVRDRFVTGAVEIGAPRRRHVGLHAPERDHGCPPRCIVSAHSVVNTPLTEELTFYSGNPAEAVRTLPESLGFFHRGEDPDADQDIVGVRA